jgi:tRNA uracil 4-sulfurtransferase
VQLDALVVHYHEIGLKGRNRNFFENMLARNLKRALRGTGYKRVRQGFGRMMIDFDDDGSPQEAAERAARVFGVAYVGLGVRVPPELDTIAEVGLELMGAAPFETFAVRARRTYSTLPMTSNRINIEIGQQIVDKLDGKVDLSLPDATLTIELFGSTGIVFRDRRRGPGGLPAGVSGRMLALLSGGIDSPVAAWRMARRGAEIELVHFHGRPFTDPSSIRQATELAQVFTRYHLRTSLHLIPLGDVQREIVTHAPSELRVVLYRRAMMRISAELAKQREAKAIVTGDALGQVASQTIENITTVDAAQDGTPVLRPLIGMDKQEIVDLAKHIGTYEISTRQYQDCCVLFEPRSPATRANVHIAEAGESELDMEALVGKALAGIETTILDYPAPTLH